MEILYTFTFICIAGLSFYFGKTKLRRFKKKGYYWSIGYQSSSDPFKWDPAKAKIYDRDQLPIEAITLADPFLFKHKNTLYLFHEVVLKSVPEAKIGVSVYDTDNSKWIFQAIVLDEPFHLSYPYIFTHDSEIYMIPESKQAQSVRLYRATDFPLKWELEKIIIKDKKYVDPTICFWQNRFYLFVTRKRRMYLYHSESLTEGWQLHVKSPIKFWNHGRCAGKIFEHNNILYRFAQEQAKGYGMGVHCYQIRELSQTKYKEVYVGSKPIFKPFGDGWAKKGMHHIDILKISENNYFAVFDGRSK
ncbi:MAG: hypothetical protein HF978_04960 [Desulfobacteraceae bacterium]|nr:hypothetical protein [Desulfobacteraceae bacterium]MBC2754880.1 hypothetical protein [Desulfobacteraceae bacterium]